MLLIIVQLQMVEMVYNTISQVLQLTTQVEVVVVEILVLQLQVMVVEVLVV